MQTSWIRRAAAGALLLLSVPAFAQAPQTDPWSFDIEGGFAAQQEADFSDAAGGFSVDREFISAGLDYRWSFRDSVGVSIGGGNADYDFSGTVGAAPWGKIEDRRISFSGRFALGETGSIFIIPTLRLNGESDARSSDSRSWGVMGGVAWRLDENLTIGPGIGVFGRIEDSTRVFPILLIDWNIGERWNLSTGRGLAASQGPGLTLSYRLAEAWSLRLTGRYEEIQFRLGDRGPAPGGVGTDQAIPLVLGAAWEPNPSVALSVFAGMEFGGGLELKDAAGRVLWTQDYDPAPLLGATFAFRF